MQATETTAVALRQRTPQLGLRSWKMLTLGALALAASSTMACSKREEKKAPAWLAKAEEFKKSIEARAKAVTVQPAPPDVAAPPADALKTPGGVFYKVLKPTASAVHPQLEDAVKVALTTWATDGKMLGSTVGDWKIIWLPKTAKGWAEAVSTMALGEKRRLWIPEELAYKNMPGKPQGMLVSDVELFEIVTPATPTDLEPVPAAATKLPSGVAYQVLAAGRGTRHPKESEEIQVNVNGWSSQGKLFSSSSIVGKPEQFKIEHVIPAWKEMLLQMTPGEKRRVWVPKSLCPPANQEVPEGPLVFDLELWAIMDEKALQQQAQQAQPALQPPAEHAAQPH